MPQRGGLHRFSADASAIAFPLGGIGTGNVSVGARGNLVDWEIEGEPAKGTTLPNAVFGLWVGGAEPTIRVLEGPLPRVPQASHGYHPTSHAGIPRFKESVFTGTYPIGHLELVDDELPIAVEMEFWTPLVPLDADESGIPTAVLQFKVQNRSDSAVPFAICGSMINPVGRVVLDPFGTPSGTRFGRASNRLLASDELTGVVFDNAELRPDQLPYGNVCLATDHDGAMAIPCWYRGGWWDDVRHFWRDFGANGELNAPYQTGPSPGKPDTGSVAAKAELAPGEVDTVRFYLSWYFPNRRNGWYAPANIPVIWDGEEVELVRKRYAGRFSDSTEVTEYVHSNRDHLDGQTRAFRDALFDSTLPDTIIRAVSANIVPLRSPTCFWLEDGSFYGWEGCFDNAGSCAGTCTHVWSYAYTSAFLFPELERAMRSNELRNETAADGFISCRAHAVFGEEFEWQWAGGPTAAIDGHMGTIVRTWREYLLSSDIRWLEEAWQPLRRAAMFAIKRWDPERTGLVTGEQHNTYDIEFHGINPLAQFLYVTGLQAASSIAAVLGHFAEADEWRRLADKGGSDARDRLWNGSYFVQPSDDIDAYPYQHGDGCLSDQLLAYVHARACALPSPTTAADTRSTYKAIYEHNFRSSLQDHRNYQRVYAHSDQSGLLLCTWPAGGEPKEPFPYSDEVWPGCEYHVAAGMLWVGLVDEALTILDATARRHDGVLGNPWDEVECGHHYARSMSSYLLLLAALGQATTADRELTFDPVMALTEEGQFSSFYSDGRSWGTIEVGSTGRRLRVLGGEPPKSAILADGGAFGIQSSPSGVAQSHESTDDDRHRATLRTSGRD